MNREKLETIIEVLKTVPDDQFDSNNWRTCAIGHAGSAIGLHFNSFNNPIFNGQRSFEAVADCLGITVEDAESLFRDGYPCGDITPQMMIDSIRGFMNAPSNVLRQS